MERMQPEEAKRPKSSDGFIPRSQSDCAVERERPERKWGPFPLTVQMQCDLQESEMPRSFARARPLRLPQYFMR